MLENKNIKLKQINIMTNRIYIYIGPINIKFPGFTLIANRILEYIPNTEIINSLSKRKKQDFILPMGMVAALDLINKGFPCENLFLIDALTLGFKSVVKFYWKYSRIWSKGCIIDFLHLIKYTPWERKVISHYKRIIVVSKHDQEYLENRYGGNKFYTVTNGVSLPNQENIKKKEFSYTLGFLHYWGCGAINEVDWFIKNYLPKLKKRFPELKVIAAGRGADDKVKAYFKKNDITFMGEVEHLSDFFNSIDIYITTVRKECGILNKVLDAFAHKKIVLGLKHNMYPFEEINDSFLTYENYQECENAIEFIASNNSLISQKEEKAYKYIQKEHCWQANINRLYNIITKND